MRLTPALLPACAALALACAPPPLADDDVGFLVPLAHARTFLPSSAGVLPREVFDRLHPLTVVDEPDVLFGALATVAVRLDPCFQEGNPPSACRPQLRLVLQPVMDSPEGLTTRDAAVHVFFELDAATVKATVKELNRLRVTQGGTFEREPWRSGATALLRGLVKRDRLSRVTQMSVHASNQAWVFNGYEVKGAALEDIRIATVNVVEGHVTSTGGTMDLALTLDPAPAAEPSLPDVLQKPRRDAASMAALEKSAAALARLEDPAAHNPGTVDCGACHAAATATRFLQGSPVKPMTPTPPDAVYADTRNLRAFGYFFATPAVSPRVKREIAAVRTTLAAQLEKP
jgi:mono/diheme cytochrome c family protein